MIKKTGIVLGVITALVAITFAGWGFTYLTAPLKGRVDAEVQIESAHSRIGRYEYFFDLCASVQQMEASLEAQRELLGSLTENKDKVRVGTNIAGLKSQLAGAVAKYNTESAKSYTAARFKASNLPIRLSTGGSTQCVVSY